MNILVIAEDVKPGGATVVLLRLLDLLRRQGHDVTCLTGDEAASSFATEGIIHDVRAEKGGWGLRGRLREILPARRLISELRPEVLVVHAVSPGYFYAAMYQDISVLYYFHSVIEERSSSLRKQVYSRIDVRTKRLAAVSAWHRNNIVTQWGVSGETLRLLPNYPDRQVVMQERRDVILTAGRFHWSKNPEIWRATGRLLETELAARGLSMVWCAPSLDEADRVFVDSLPSSLIVEVISSQAQLDAYFSRALLYYQPSAVEPQGIAVLEAMQNGIPVVVTDNTGMLDAVTDGVTGRVVPRDDAAAHAIMLRALLDEAEGATQLGEAGREFVRNHRTRELWEQSVLDVINELGGSG